MVSLFIQKMFGALKPRVVPRPTLHNVIFHTILDDFLYTRVLSSHYYALETILPKAKAELIRDVPRWRHAWLVIIHVYLMMYCMILSN